jgi:beta-glucosidase-like glycosyl hydrolase
LSCVLCFDFFCPHPHPLRADPRWGRNIESAGEDPFVSGQYAANFVQGFEHATETPYPLQASACCKHFVANELDGWNGTDRNHIDVFVPQQDLVDSYLPSFQTCVEEGKVSGIMCSYNAVNGVPSCANDWLLGTLLRESWQFDGYVTSDCDADSDVFNSHHYTKTAEEAVAVIPGAGTDVDCGGFMTANAQKALDGGNIQVSDIDTVLTRLFKMRIRMGFFDPPTALDSIGPESVCNDYALELARDGVRQSAVLAKNDAGLLPLSAAAINSAVVIGPKCVVRAVDPFFRCFAL